MMLLCFGQEKLHGDATGVGCNSPSRTDGGKRGSCQEEKRWCGVSAADWWLQAPHHSAGFSSTPGETSAHAGNSQQHQSSAVPPQ